MMSLMELEFKLAQARLREEELNIFYFIFIFWGKKEYDKKMDAYSPSKLNIHQTYRVISF